ncbi:type II secretion system protein GspG [Heliorestis convoluta]|uniref:Type II secretion protein GspG n=1 Tax=Heliorestis convoluta TaxID=356322 RepID=A0A5Q2N6P9_9FIRM|nr:type II secretion system protein GspG [Heliorestis convoluta]QGG49052.1 Type II secretion protein GspG [Heliorestis convoluta]
MLKKVLKDNKGFSLIELIIVVAVIGILLVVIVPKIGGVPIKAQMAGVKSDFLAIETVVKQYYLEYNRLPNEKEIDATNMLDYKLNVTEDQAKDDGGYIDPWNNLYIYKLDSSGVTVTSKGPDGIEDTGDDTASDDITVNFSVNQGRIKTAFD